MHSNDLASVFERHGVFRVWRRRTPEAEQLLAAMLPDPDRIFTQGEKLASPWRGAATSKRRVMIGSGDYFLKRYNSEGWIYRLKNALRPSRAVRAWQAVEAYHVRGVSTPIPLLCLEERQGLLLGRAYLLFPFIAGQPGSFLDLWPSLTDTERCTCLGKLGSILGNMHRQGLLHGDLNWRNILAVRQGDGFDFWLVDLDGSRIVAKSGFELAMKDLCHFYRDMERAQLDVALKRVFDDSWRSASGLAGANTHVGS